MIKLYLINNVRRVEVGEIDRTELLQSNDVVETLCQRFEKLGIQVDCECGNFYMEHNQEISALDINTISDAGMVAYVSIASPQNATPYDTYGGIEYFFHTAETGHMCFPHIHAKIDDDEISIYLRDLHVVGKAKNPSKQNKAVKYVKRHRTHIGSEWNNLIETQGGPRWEG